MAQALTLTIGAALWWLAMGTVDTRTTMGRGWPIVHLAVWGFVTSLACWQHGRTHVRGPGGGRRLWVQVVQGVGLAFGWVVIMGFVFGFLPVGEGPTSVWLYGAGLALAVLPVAGLLVLALRALLPSGPADVEPLPKVALVRTLAPLLMLPVCLSALRLLDAPPPWDTLTAPTGRAGVLAFIQLPGLLACALLVAWGLDQLGGRESSWSGDLVPVAAVTALVVLAVWLPDQLIAWQDEVVLGAQAAGSHGPPDGYASGLRFRHPFSAVQRVDGTLVRSALPIGALTVGGMALLLAAGLWSARALARLGRTRAGAPHPASLGLALLVGLGGALWLAPSLGPAAAPWSATVGIALGAGWDLLRRRGAPKPDPDRAATS